MRVHNYKMLHHSDIAKLVILFMRYREAAIEMDLLTRIERTTFPASRSSLEFITDWAADLAISRRPTLPS